MQGDVAVELAGQLARPSASPQRPLIVRIGKRARTGMNRFLSRFSLVPLDPILDTADFPWLRDLEAAAPAIQEEARQVLRHLQAVPPINELSPDHHEVAKEGGWRSFFLVGYGQRVEANCKRCPATMQALSNVPGLVTALYSILEPGMHVGRHCGISKCIVIAHLGLFVPREAERCRMQVEDQWIHWREGATFVFDDTFPHEVWNDTSENRVILLVQFQRPMTLIGRIITRLLVWVVRKSPYIQDANANMNYWEQRFRDSESRAGSE